MNMFRMAREEVGLTQEQVAKMLSVDQSTVSYWESGDVKPRADKLPQLAKLYGCKIDDLFDDTDRPAGIKHLTRR